VLTPWFIDAVEAELPLTLSALSRALRPGGLWVNYGPLRFDGRIGSRYMLEDVLELVERAGFERPAPIEANVSYFHAPHAGSRRTETVFAFAVRKLLNAPEQAAPAAVLHTPSWLRDPSLAIPLGEELLNAKRSAVFNAGLLSMIDGTRSIHDLAATLSQQWRLPAERLVPKLQALLERLAIRARHAGR
jgi:hypothetical protein